MARKEPLPLVAIDGLEEWRAEQLAAVAAQDRAFTAEVKRRYELEKEADEDMTNQSVRIGPPNCENCSKGLAPNARGSMLPGDPPLLFCLTCTRERRGHA